MTTPMLPRLPINRLGRLLMLLAITSVGPGCAAISNPVADGIPVSRLPDELRGTSREGLRPIPLTMLRQKPIEVHLVGPGDVLGIVIENVLGGRDQSPPVRIDGTATPAIGYPILVQDDGTIALPYVDLIKVEGMTLNEVQERLRKAYTVDRQILVPGKERIIVTLLQARRFHILVLRQDGGTAGVPVGPSFNSANVVVGASVKGTGFPLDMSIGENDVLNALTRTGGLPGTDAKNEVTIYKKNAKNPDGTDLAIRIPLRLKPGTPPPFKPKDVVLESGDIVYLEARDSEVFYTAGILGAGQFPLPRDIDLDIVEAVTFVRGPLLNGGFGQAQFGGAAINPGIGTESPSLITVLRTTSTGRQLTIKIDLNEAMKDPRERLIVQSGDIIVMQEMPSESIWRYFSQRYAFGITSQLIQGVDFQGVLSGTIP